MEWKKKLSRLFLLFSVLLLSGCSVAGIKIIEPLSAVKPDSWENSGLTFQNINEIGYTLYDVGVYTEANNDEANFITELPYNTQLSLNGISTDQSYATIDYNGAYAYIERKYLSPSEVSEEDMLAFAQSIEEELAEAQRLEEEARLAEEAASLEAEEAARLAEEEARLAEEQAKREEEAKQLDQEGVIRFPEAPEGVTVEGGATFATVDVLGVTRTNALIYSAPNINDFDKIDELKAEQEVKVIGVGSNGFLKIELSDGKIGYVDGQYVKKQEKEIESAETEESSTEVEEVKED